MLSSCKKGKFEKRSASQDRYPEYKNISTKMKIEKENKNENLKENVWGCSTLTYLFYSIFAWNNPFEICILSIELVVLVTRLNKLSRKKKKVVLLINHP